MWNTTQTEERSTLDLKAMRKNTQSPKQEQSVALQNGPWSNKKNFKKEEKKWKFHKNYFSKLFENAKAGTQ